MPVEALPGASWVSAFGLGAVSAVFDNIPLTALALRQGGYHIAASPLQPVETATTIRVRNGTLTIHDGPATSAPEQLGGFYLIDARDLNDAIRVATRMPPARYGSVEVRPLKEICPDACRSSAPPNDYSVTARDGL